SFSSQTIHGTGSFPATVAPPATDGFSAVRLVWMFSEGTRAPSVRSWPEGRQWFTAALKRLGKMLVVGSAKFLFGSYQVTHGTVRRAPAKTIDGASATTVGSMLRHPGNPCFTPSTRGTGGGMPRTRPGAWSPVAVVAISEPAR